MGWKRLIALVTVVAILASGGHVLESINHVSKTAVAGFRSSLHGAESGRAQASQNRSKSQTVQLKTSHVTGFKAQASKPADLTAKTQIDPAVPHDAPIPKNALRLRIIANSDSAADQQLKREVRNVIVVQVAKLIKGATTEAQAQKIVTNHVSSLRSLAQQVVHNHGFRYDVKAKVGNVPFPTKVYGNRVYPAGNYKALRFILGKGQGKNWWCVLFPPLCFVDIADGDAVPNTGGFPDLPPLETITVPNMQGKPTKVAVRLASVDYGEELWKTIKQWL